jgi:hypothetical protein
VPAFGVLATDLFSVADNRYVRFDATAAGSLAVLAPLDGGFGGGAFADGDFSRQYVTRGYKTATGGALVHGREYLLAIDTATGAATTIGRTGLDDALGASRTGQALAWDASTNTLYGVYEVADGTPAGGSYLVVLDRYTGAAQPVGRLALDQAAADIGAESVIGLAVDRDGAMYAIAAGAADEEGSHGALLAVDKATAATRTIGPLGDQAPFLLPLGLAAFDLSTNRLYLNGLDLDDVTVKTYEVDTATGTASPQVTVADPLLINAFSIAADGGPCVGDGGAPWLAVAPDGGSIAPGARADVALAIDASALAAGTYQAVLCLRSDDPYRHLVPLRVNLHVAGDPIFADGFDAAPAP